MPLVGCDIIREVGGVGALLTQPVCRSEWSASGHGRGSHWERTHGTL